MELVICDIEAGTVIVSQPFDFRPDILEPIKLGPAAGSLIVPLSRHGFVLWDYFVGECLDRRESFAREGVGFIVGESTEFYGYSENAVEVSCQRGMHSRYLRHHSDAVLNVRSVGHNFWSTSVGKTLRICDLPSGELVKTHRLDIENCRPIVANDSYVATVYENFQIAVWDASALELSCVLSGHVQEITYLEWLAPHLLVSASEDMCIRVWDTVQETLLCELTIDAPIAAGSYAPTERIIIIGDKGGRVHFLKLEL
jgi:WD40 repeat protein